MWHEARKQERMIRGMIVDYRKRAERRKDFYEKIKAEPTQFLQLHGRRCKIHLDPTIASAGEGPAIMMPWQGDSSNMIDRFDVRAHLDFIPEIKNPYVPPEELEPEERQCNYERYRILAQNAFLAIGEDKFLQQLAIEEQFGVTIEEKEAQKEKLHEKKGSGAAIGYNYNDPGAQPGYSNGPETNKKVETNDSDDDSDLEIIDVDLSIDVNKMDSSQAHELNAVGPQFGMAGCDLFSYLTGDADDAEHQKQLLREEKEKAMFSGRKSRRERRAHRDKKLATRVVSPPSYAAPAPAPPAAPPRSPSRSPERSRSATPDVSGGIQFITSFGGEEDEPTAPATAPAQKPLYADKLKHNLKKVDSYSEALRKNRSGSSKPPERKFRPMGPHRPGSRSRSRSTSRSRSRSRSWKRSRSRSYSRSRSVSSTRSLGSRSRSRSPARYYRSRHSRSPVNQASGYAKHNDSSYESHDRSAPPPPAPALPRYYGRRKEDKSSSDLSSDSDSTASSDGAKNKLAVGNKSNTNQNQLRLSGSSSKGPSRETLTLKEKLKRKMQAQLTRQLRADKRAEAERLERESRRQARRDEEMRELAIKLRRKQREMRHQQNRRSSDEDSDGTRSRSSSRLSRESPTSPKRLRNSRSRSKSASPPQHIPVWETEPSTSSYRSRAEDEGHYQHQPYPARRRYPDNTDRRYPDNTDKRYPDNTDRRYPDNTDRRYPDNTDRRYPDNMDKRYPDNTDRRYPDNTDKRYPDNTDRRYPDADGYHNRDERNFDHHQRRPDERSLDHHQYRHPRREYGPRAEYAGGQGHDGRWEPAGRRRPYGARGRAPRPEGRPAPGDAPAAAPAPAPAPGWRRGAPGRAPDSPAGNRNRVKLVDY